MNVKEELITVLEIAEINFLMSLKELKPEFVNTKATANINPISWIVGHCFLNFDRFVSFYTNKQILTKEESEFYIYGYAKETEKDYSVPFVKLIDLHLELSQKLFEILQNIDVKEFDKIPQGQVKGTIAERIESVALHVMGHTGQIVLIRRILDNPFWAFIQGVFKEDRKKFREEWITWWEENKSSYS